MNEKWKNRIRAFLGIKVRKAHYINVTHFIGEPTSVPKTPQPELIIVSTKQSERSQTANEYKE